MSPSEIFSAAPRLALLVAGLLVPGSLVLRAGRLPWSLAGSFVCSCALLYVSLLAGIFLHLPLGPATLGGGLAAGSLAAGLIAARRPGPIPPGETTPGGFLTSLGGWSLLYLALWAIVIYRLGTDPLSGPDVHFRWSYLAEQMLRFHSLGFYPPQTSGDFVRYFWPESIPPGIAGIYAWAYGCAGTNNGCWTGPVVVLQLLALHDLVWRLAYRHGGANAGRWAVLLAAACPLVTWSFLIGQETGLLTVAIGGLVWCLDRSEKANGPAWAVLGGFCAIVAASTREYGPVYAVAAVAAAAVVPATRRHVLLWAAVALPVAAAWPLRVWALTGNPVYSLDLAGVFPTNAAFVSWNNAFRSGQQSALGSLTGWVALARYLGLWALPATLGLPALVVLIVRRQGGALLMAAFVALASALWFASVAYTAGGLFYSLRALAPAFALLIVAAGRTAATLAVGPAARRWLGAGLALLSLEALPKTLVLPDNPYRLPIREWPGAGRKISETFHRDEPAVAAKLAQLPGPRRVISDGFDLPRLAAPLGFEIDPPWSPEVDWLLDQAMDPVAAARRWQTSGLRFFIVGRTGPMFDYLRRHVRWTTPYYTIEAVDQTEGHVFFEIKATGVPIPPLQSRHGSG